MFFLENIYTVIYADIGTAQLNAFLTGALGGSVQAAEVIIEKPSDNKKVIAKY